MTKKVLIFLFALTSVAFTTKAQDILIKDNNEQLKVKIIEIGTTEIKYKLHNAPNGPTISILKSDVKTLRIQGEDGKMSTVVGVNDDPMSLSNRKIIDKTSAIKFHFLSPLNNHLGFTYEWMIKPGMNTEFGIGIIGPGTSFREEFNEEKPSGAFFRGGIKVLFGSKGNIEVTGARLAHPLKGPYLKLIGSFYAFKIKRQLDTLSFWLPNPGSSTLVDVEDRYTGVGLNLVFGNQFILGNVVTLDIYGGFGYGAESYRTNFVRPNFYYDLSFNRYSHYYYGQDIIPMTINFGLSIGYILRTPDWLSRGKFMTYDKDMSRRSMRE